MAVSAGTSWGYLVLAAANAASYLLAAVLLLRWRDPTADPSSHAGAASRQAGAPDPGQQRRGGYRALLTDRGLLLVSGTNLVFVLCTSVLTILLAVYLTTVLGAPVWLSGALFTLDTVLVVTGQGAITRMVSRYHRPTVLKAAAGCFAASFVLLWALSSAPSRLLVPGLVVAIAIFTLAEMLEGPLINALVVDLAPTSASGRYLAAYQLSWSLGAVAAPGLLTWLLTLNTALPWITLLGFCALATSAIGLIPEPDVEPSAPR